MKPNTALAFVLAGLALVLLSGTPVSPRLPAPQDELARQAGRAHAGQVFALLVALIGGLTLCEYLFSWQLGIDELLFKDDPNAAATLSPGRMAPSTAVNFLLLGLALVGIEWEPRRGLRPAELLALVAGVVGLSSLVEYAVGQPILFGFSQYTRMALHTAVVFLVLSAGVLLARPAQGMVGALRSGRVSPWERAVYAAMALALLGVLAGGAWFYRAQEQPVRRKVEAELETIAQLKADQIVQWREKCLGDAGVLMSSVFFTEGVARWLANPKAEVGDKILTRFRALQQCGHYHDVLLVDGRGQVRLSISNRPPPFREDTVQAFAAAFQTRRPVLTDLHLPPGDPTPYLEIIAPLFAGSETTNEPIGAVVLQSEARQFLYPLIQSWPTPSPSAETLLVRREGDSVLFLNELRHRADTAFKLRIPLTRQEVPAVMVVLGREGVFHGTDYRGVKVLSVLKRIPDTSWFLVAKMDEAEALAEWRFRAGLIVAVVGLLVLALAVAARIMGQQRARYRDLAQSAAALRASEIRYRRLFESAKDGILILDVGTGMIVDVNPFLIELLGFSRESFLGKKVWELGFFKDIVANEANFAELQRKDYARYENMPLKTSDGRQIEAEFVSNVYLVNGQKVIQCNIRDVTARKWAEQEIRALNADLERRVQERTVALGESEERFRQLSETMPDAVLVVQDGRNVYANRAAARLLGTASPEEVVGLEISAVIDPAGHEAARQNMQRLLAGEKLESFEARFVRRDGSLVPVEISASLFPWQGRPALQVVARDITARKEAEAALLKAGALQSAIFNSANFSSIATDAKGVIQIFNVGAERMLGYAAADVMNKITPADISDPQEVIARAKALSAELETPITPGFEALVFKASRGIEDIYELTYIRKDGSRFPAVVSVTALRDAQGAIIGYLLIGTDNTARKEAALALRENEERFRTLANNISQLAWMADAQGAIFWYNQRWFDYTGTTLEEMSGWGWQKVHHPDHVQGVVDKIKHCFETGEVWEDTFPLRGADGHYRWFLSRAVPIRDEHGTVLRWFGTNTDVTEQKQAEAAIRQLNAEVHQRAAELETANAELAQVAKLKDEFLANMSHELRTPLNAILGLSEALLEQVSGTLTPRQVKSVTTISTSGQHLLTLINDILDLSKIEAGKLELHLDTVNVQEFCESCLLFVRTQAMQKHIGVAFEHDGRVAKLSADPKRLKQVLVNLLTNAVKFTPEGGRIGLTVAAPKGEDVARFTVWDTGIGIAPEDQTKLFRAFTQIDSGLTRAQEGTGLGLVLVAKLVELHGGSVAFESEPGKGSRFTVTLPQIAARAPAPKPAPKDQTDRRSYHHALIIEDDPASAGILADYLTELGLSSVVYVGGEEAVEAVLRERPDLILLDIQLPGESGWVVLAKLKEHPGARDIPVVVVSVVDEPEKSRALGAAAHFTKPVTRAQLAGFFQRPAVPRRPSATPWVALPPSTGPSILLAEDNEANIQTVGNYLEDKGYAMHYAMNGLVAVQLARELRPALILMDIQMPVMDGLTAIREVRADAALQAIPIVALTALAMPGDRERCLAAGATDYLSKPVSLKALAALMARLLPPAGEGKREA
jgi:PAS domain S-box-containing protein